MFKCKKCNFENGDNSKYCSNCGELLEKSVCKKCNNSLSDTNLYCPYCGELNENTSNIKKIKYCNNCQKALDEKFLFCPDCGSSFSYIIKPEKPKNNQFNKEKFELITKISIASVSFILIILLLFAPIYKSKVCIQGEFNSKVNEVNYYMNGVDIIRNGIYALSEYTYEEADEDYDNTIRRLDYKYGLSDNYELSAHKIRILVNKIDIYRFYSLVDTYYSNNENYNLTYELSFITSMLNVLTILGLLIAVLIISLLSIKKHVINNKISKLLIISLCLYLLFITCFRIPGIDKISSSKLGFGSVISIILVIAILALIYLYNIFSKNIKFNLFKLLSRGVTVILLIITTGLLNGEVIKMKYTYYNKVISPVVDVHTMSTSFDAYYNYEEILTNNDNVWPYLNTEAYFNNLFAQNEKYIISTQNSIVELLLSDKVLDYSS